MWWWKAHHSGAPDYLFWVPATIWRYLYWVHTCIFIASPWLSPYPSSRTIQNKPDMLFTGQPINAGGELECSFIYTFSARTFPSFIHSWHEFQVLNILHPPPPNNFRLTTFLYNRKVQNEAYHIWWDASLLFTQHAFLNWQPPTINDKFWDYFLLKFSVLYLT